jgi:hypothetical protein
VGGVCSTYGERIVAYRVSVGKPEGKRPLGIPGHRWEDNIKKDVQGVKWRTWTGLMWLRVRTVGELF